jgi:hypothetical protein
VRLPGICAVLAHNPHVGSGQDLESWLEQVRDLEQAEIAPEDEAEIRRTGEVWELSWCAGFRQDPERAIERSVAASTIYRVLLLAGVATTADEVIAELMRANRDQRDAIGELADLYHQAGLDTGWNIEGARRVDELLERHSKP